MLVLLFEKRRLSHHKDGEVVNWYLHGAGGALLATLFRGKGAWWICNINGRGAAEVSLMTLRNQMKI